MRSLSLLLLFAILYSCNRPSRRVTENEVKSNVISNGLLFNPNVTSEGIVFFSINNGLTWENKSEGLPDKAQFGLGAIAVSDDMLGIAMPEFGVYLYDFQKDFWVRVPTDKQILENHPRTLAFYKDDIFVGTQKKGVFYTADHGKSWLNLTKGLGNLTIRKLVQVDSTLYAGTDAGLYSYLNSQKKWELQYGNGTLQVNGITEFDGSIYIGTNQGAFTSSIGGKAWTQILPNRTLHNISSDENTIYAMVYSELLSSVDKGKSWQNIQKGLPADLYTFNVVKNGNSVFAGQWDGVYRKDNVNDIWRYYSNGLPNKLAITNMKLYKGIIVVSGNERGLRKGMTTNR